MHLSLKRGGVKQILIHINDPNLAHRPTDLDPDPNKNPDRYSLSLYPAIYLSRQIQIQIQIKILTDSLSLSLFLSHTILRGVIIFLPPLASFTPPLMRNELIVYQGSLFQTHFIS